VFNFPQRPLVCWEWGGGEARRRRRSKKDDDEEEEEEVGRGGRGLFMNEVGADEEVVLIQCLMQLQGGQDAMGGARRAQMDDGRWAARERKGMVG
jgi:hypothetical protein